MAKTKATRKASQPLAESTDDPKMDHLAMVEKREMEAFLESQEARKQLQVSVRQTREKRAKFNECQKLWLELHRLRDAMMRAEKAESEEIEIDSETGARVSAMLLQVLEQVREGTVAQLVQYLAAAGVDIKKAHVSATLYNLKKRGAIEHSEVTGRYRLAAPGNVHQPAFHNRVERIPNNPNRPK